VLHRVGRTFLEAKFSIDSCITKLAWGSGVVPRRDRLHRRDLQDRREDDLRPRRVAGGSLGNSSLDGTTRRAINLHEGDEIDEAAFQALIRAAVALNTSRAADRPTKKSAATRSTA
jgi:hypothetical protein